MNDNTRAAEVFGEELRELQGQLSGEIDSTALRNISARFREIQSEAKQMALTNQQALESTMNTGLSNGKFKSDLDMVEMKFQTLGTESTELRAQLQQLRESFYVMSNSDNSLEVRIDAMRDYMGLLPGVRAQIQQLSTAETLEGKALKEVADAQIALTNARTLSNNIQTWMNENTKAAEQFGEELRELQARLSTNLDSSELRNISARFREIQSEAKQAGLANQEALENTLNTGLSNGKFKADLDAIVLKFGTLKTESTELSANFNQLKESFATMSNPDNSLDVRIDAMRNYMDLLPGVRAQIQQLSTAETLEAKAIKEAATEQLNLTNARTLSNNIQVWMNNNTKAAEVFGEELKELQARLSGKIDSTELRNVSARFREIQSEAKQAGLVTNTFAKSMKNFVLQCAGLTSGVAVFHKVTRVIGEGINQIVELDDALIDLQKTTDATQQQLNDFYYDANEIAKQYGATTQEIIQSAADWSRLGYSIEDAETMSKVSSIFKSISPGLDIERATDGLVSAMKAFDIEAEDALDGIASKINAIGKLIA